MTITGETKAHLSDLLPKVEAGEDVIISRGRKSIAKLSRFRRENDVDTVVAEILAARAGRAKTTIEEILSWKAEGRR